MKLVVVLLLICVVISCKEHDNFLSGYNTDELFADPSQQEINAVLADWNSRDLSPGLYDIEQSIQISDDLTLKMISYDVSGLKEYAALLIPKSDQKMPVRMYFDGFGYDVTVNSLKLVAGQSSSAKPFIFAVPALRGQSLDIEINEIHYTSPLSEGEHCDAFDRAADDGIAMLNVIESMEPSADMNRVSVRGGSRGATVALLMGIRDSRVKKSVAVAGPANLLELTSAMVNDLTYRCQFLDNLVHKKYSVAQARHIMIASSPVFFARMLPSSQMHLATDDTIVPVSQGDELKAKADPQLFQLFTYPGRDHTNIANENTEMNARIESFLSDL
jgi:hypothetical protein